MEIKYEIIRKEKAKKMILKVVDTKVKVTVPNYVPMDIIKAFLKENQNWILEKIKEQKENVQKPHKNKEFVLYLGTKYILKIEKTKERKFKVQKKEKEIILFIPKEIKEEQESKAIKNLLILFYKEEAKILFAKKLRYFAQIMDVNYNKLTIKDQKTRWGSCSSKKNINLNYRLILAPEKVLDYVIIHELAHLVHMNHSKDFWSFVEKFQKDYKSNVQWLKENYMLLEI